MSRAPRKPGGRRLTPAAWVLIALVVAVAVGLATGTQALWIAALVVLLFILMGAFAIPRNVQRLNIPPFLPNARGDETTHDDEGR
jgi:hypothetical protein